MRLCSPPQSTQSNSSEPSDTLWTTRTTEQVPLGIWHSILGDSNTQQSWKRYMSSKCNGDACNGKVTIQRYATDAGTHHKSPAKISCYSAFKFAILTFKSFDGIFYYRSLVRVWARCIEANDAQEHQCKGKFIAWQRKKQVVGKS